MLAPQLDATFDRGFITVADDGAAIAAPALPDAACTVLGLARPLRVTALADGHCIYLH